MYGYVTSGEFAPLLDVLVSRYISGGYDAPKISMLVGDERNTLFEHSIAHMRESSGWWNQFRGWPHRIGNALVGQWILMRIFVWSILLCAW
jgi:hypothetical protein